MKKLSVLFLLTLFSFCTFAQNVDFINAPLNPVPFEANRKQKNLKGDVFQTEYRNYSRAGQRIFYNEEKPGNQHYIKLDAAGRIIQDGRTEDPYYYSYDTKGNLIQKLSKNQTTNYSYDTKNRLITEVYIDKRYGDRLVQFSYTKKNELLIVNIMTTKEGKNYEREEHYKDGLLVYEKRKGNDAIISEYEFDAKGNWIKKTDINVVTKSPETRPLKREIIYYDELDKGASAFSVVAEKTEDGKSETSPTLYLNNKIFGAPFSIFANDYVFYEELSKTYYVARGAADKNNSIGKKTAVEKLVSGSPAVLFYDGETFGLAKNGRNLNANANRKFLTYLDNYIVKDSGSDAVYACGRLPKLTAKNQLVAVAAINMLDPASSVWYIYDAEKKGISVFDRGELTNCTIAGYTEKDTTLVLAINNTPRVVLTGYPNVSDKVMTQGRYFDPAKDKLKATKP